MAFTLTLGYTGPQNRDFIDAAKRALYYGNTRPGYWGTPKQGSYFGYALVGSGHIENPDGPMEPRSLFKQKLIDRIGKEKAEAILK